MNILFDALGLPPYGGTRSSSLGWMRGVARVGGEHRFIVVVSRYERALEHLDNLEQIVVESPGRFGVRLWAQRYLPALVQKRHISLVHFTKNHSCFFIPCPKVVTINDLSRFYQTAMFSRVDIFYWRTVQKALLKSADKIIAISENTRRDLLLFYGLPPERIEVIYPAPSARFLKARADDDVSRTLAKYGIRSPYILNVGGLAMHKNTYTALKAFCLLQDGGHLTEYTFVIVGGKIHTHNDVRLEKLAATRGGGVLLVGEVSDGDIVDVYAGASLFVYPSLYEGFGIAPLEAMACGVPVLSSGAGALPEVLGDAAWIVEDPYDVKGFAEGMLQILTDKGTASRMRRRGRDNVSRFSWTATARRTLNLYESLVSAL